MPRKQDPQSDTVAVEYEEVIIVAAPEEDGTSALIEDSGSSTASRSGNGRRARTGDVDEEVETAVAENNREEVERAHRKGPDKSRVRRSGSRRGSSGRGSTGKALVGLGLAAATAGAAVFLSRKLKEEQPTGPLLSDAPDHVLRGKAKERAINQDPNKALIGRTVTIGRPRQELYERWRDFTRFPEFMDNVREITKLDNERSQWTIAAPMGATVNVVTRIVEDKPGETIAWVSEPDSQIETDGRVEFADAPPGRGTYVRLLVRYKPPAGVIGQAIAKVLQREPNVQARRDLRRFKQLIETGEVSVNASPSARRSESPTEARV